MVADLVRQVGGDRVEVDQLMGPGVDPHLYKPTSTDAGRLSKADVIFYSGLMLEGRMGDLFAMPGSPRVVGAPS
jgi:manganese/zinc/iron transport system substrate-binding protein